MAMRMDQKPFNDIRVRRAMNLAINKKEIIDSFYGGNAEMHTYPFPPSFKDVYTPLEKLPPSARELYTYNPEKAKKLLAEAGYPNGFTFKAQISNASQERTGPGGHGGGLSGQDRGQAGAWNPWITPPGSAG